MVGSFKEVKLCVYVYLYCTSGVLNLICFHSGRVKQQVVRYMVAVMCDLIGCFLSSGFSHIQ